ncbi:MAG: spore coat-associated protein [Gaiellaceae bacterium]|jgi:hypothetical protein|nr:spore coat-associated protein [Gaiellaceae bacterium]
MRLLDHSGRRISSTRLHASGGLVLSAALLAALGLFATFADASSLGHISTSKKRPRLSVAPHRVARVAALAPGDRAERTVELRYRGRGRFARVVLTTKNSGSSLLGSSLRLKIERCSRRWSNWLGSRRYACRGKRRMVLRTVRVNGKRRLLLRHLSRRAGRTDHLRLTLSLPRVAGNDLQGQTSRLSYRFTGVAAR